MADYLPGTEVVARGLRWEVVDGQPIGNQTRLRLRGLGGLLAGAEIDVLTPFESISIVTREFNPSKAGPLGNWLVYHQAFLLEQALGPDAILAVQPGRLRIEPYQLVPLSRALRMNRPRILIADDVGLGKTVEAGLIVAELMSRRQIYRVLVVTPAGPLMEQWKREMLERFGLMLDEVSRDRLEHVRKQTELGANPFEHLPLAIASMDFLKQDNVLDLLERTTYDLIIMDEAHHYSETGADNTDAERVESSQRRKLAQTLARQSDALLLLTATPHDGYDRSYSSLIELLDPMLLNQEGGVRQDVHATHVVRRLKRHVRLTDPKTGELVAFPERKVIPVPVMASADTDGSFIALHRELLEFIVPALKRALRYRRYDDALTFLALLKRSTSTVTALSTTLAAVQSRYNDLSTTQAEEQESRNQRRKSLRTLKRKYARFGVLTQEEEQERDALEIEDLAQQLNLLDMEYRQGRSELERTETIATSLHLLEQYASRAHDVKLDVLLNEIKQIRQLEPQTNILVYTEYVDSLMAAQEQLKAAKVGKIVTITGNDSSEQRQQITHQFRTQDNLILISTDTSAEGLNLHDRCHHLIHLELPWNPNRLEQRNGRIDRYGQWKIPYIRYLYLCGTFEERILARLIAKYERQRDRLRAVPNTLGIGVTDLPEDGLFAALAQDDGSGLGAGRCTTIGFIDDDTEVDTTDIAEIQALLEEVDKSLRRFEQSARIHSWINDGAAADEFARDRATKALEVGRKAGDVDLMDFVKQAVRAEGGQSREKDGITWLTLPQSWRYGLENVPGWSVERGTLVVTSDLNKLTDENQEPVGFLGRAHPVVRRAIEHVRHQALGQESGLDRRVSAARSTDGQKALIFTFLGRVNSRIGREYERVIAVKVYENMTTEVFTEPRDWLPGTDDGIATQKLWDNEFAGWGDEAWQVAQAAAEVRFEELGSSFSSTYRRKFEDEQFALERWYAERVDALVGQSEVESLPLFEGLKDPQKSPFERLEAFIRQQDPNNRERLEGLALQDFYKRRHDRIQQHLALDSAGTSLLGMLMLT
ncbi:MAG: DEAD/DEAH box helicase [Chloroflexi bacterium]|nr:DEAD/DEAH box helicase [Chloroflexota bacterium]